eukprot:4721698-Prymnesium_polylepis.1
MDCVPCRGRRVALRAVCVCVVRDDGTWHADGARVGDAQQDTAGPRAVEYTHIRRPVWVSRA